MSAGSPLPAYLQLWNLTGPTTLRGPLDIVNQAQERSYFLTQLMNRDVKEMLQGGTKIQNFIMFTEENTARFHLPGATRTWDNPQAQTKYEANWRFLEDYISSVDVEYEMNEGGMTRRARFDQYKSVKAWKEKRLATSISNKMEGRAVGDAPDANGEEGTGATGTLPYSLHSLVNERNGSGTSAGSPLGTSILSPGVGLQPSFTTLQTINPTTETGWRCQQASYDVDTTNPSFSTAGTPQASSLYKTMSAMLMRLKYDEMPYKPGQSTPGAPNLSNSCIWTSLKGRVLFEVLARASQDHFRMNPQDPYYGGPSFAGIPVKYVSKLDSASVYPTSAAQGTGNGTEATAYHSGPRYIWTTNTWLHLIFHERRYFFMRPAIVPSAQPDATIIPVATWYNMLTSNRARLGIVFPCKFSGANVAAEASTGAFWATI